MNIEKYILAVVTTNPARVPNGATVFVCDDKDANGAIRMPVWKQF